MKLSKDDLKLFVITAKENSRPVLSHLMLARGWLMASDGYILALRKAVPDKEETLPEQFFFCRGWFKHLKPVTRQKKGIDEVHEVNIDDKRNVIINLYNRILKHKIEPTVTYSLPLEPTGTVPDCRNRINRGEPKAVIAVNPGLLRKVLDILPKDSGILRLAIYDSREPLEFACNTHCPDNNGEDTFTRGLIMPMYVTWEEQTWLKDEPSLALPQPLTGDANITPPAAGTPPAAEENAVGPRPAPDPDISSERKIEEVPDANPGAST